MTSSGAAGRPAREPLGVPSLQVALAVAVGLVVATVVVVAVSGSVAVRAVAVVLLWLALIALTVYVYRLLSQTGVVPQLAGERAEPVTPLGAGVSADRLRSAAVIGLRDAHALQRGTRHFAEAAASTLRAQPDLPGPGSELIELFDAQRDCAAQQAQSLARRLHELGAYPSRRADEEAVLAASLYERLLVRGLVTNARHAFGLLSLASATYKLIEHLGAVTGDETTPRSPSAAAASSSRSPNAGRPRGTACSTSTRTATRTRGCWGCSKKCTTWRRCTPACCA